MAKIINRYKEKNPEHISLYYIIAYRLRNQPQGLIAFEKLLHYKEIIKKYFTWSCNQGIIFHLSRLSSSEKNIAIEEMVPMELSKQCAHLETHSRNIEVKCTPALFGEKTSVYINRHSFYKALEWQKKEEQAEPGVFPIPSDIEKYVLINSAWDPSGRYTRKIVVVRNIDPKALILGFSIHYWGICRTCVTIDFNNQKTQQDFIALCSSEMKHQVVPAKTISSLHPWILKAEQYKNKQPISLEISFQDNDPCTYSLKGEYVKTPKKLKDVLEVMSKIDMLDQKILAKLYNFYDIPSENEIMLSRNIASPV